MVSWSRVSIFLFLVFPWDPLFLTFSLMHHLFPLFPRVLLLSLCQGLCELPSFFFWSWVVWQCVVCDNFRKLAGRWHHKSPLLLFSSSPLFSSPLLSSPLLSSPLLPLLSLLSSPLLSSLLFSSLLFSSLLFSSLLLLLFSSSPPPSLLTLRLLLLWLWLWLWSYSYSYKGVGNECQDRNACVDWVRNLGGKFVVRNNLKVVIPWDTNEHLARHWAAQCTHLISLFFFLLFLLFHFHFHLHHHLYLFLDPQFIF